LTNQLSGIKTSFGHSLNIEKHIFGEEHKFLYALLIFKVSRKTLDIIFYEAKKVNRCAMNLVLANVHVIGPVVFYDSARHDSSWSYVSLWLDGNQSDIVIFLNQR
jgi:hypothetical protein